MKYIVISKIMGTNNDFDSLIPENCLYVIVDGIESKFEEEYNLLVLNGRSINEELLNGQRKLFDEISSGNKEAVDSFIEFIGKVKNRTERLAKKNIEIETPLIVFIHWGGLDNTQNQNSTDTFQQNIDKYQPNYLRTHFITTSGNNNNFYRLFTGGHDLDFDLDRLMETITFEYSQ